MSVNEYSEKLGIDVCVELDPAALIPEERIRTYCEENKCGNYGKNYTCPPNAGSLDEIRERLKNYKHGYLFQYSRKMDLKKDWKKLIKSIRFWPWPQTAWVICFYCSPGNLLDRTIL